MKKLKYLLFLFIIFLTPRVFADTSYNMTSLITSPVNFSECGNGSYTGVELNGSTNCWNTNTRYQGTLNRIYFNLPSPTGSSFESDTTYRLTLNMATQDWRNNFGTVVVNPGSSYTNNFVDTFTFVSMKQINITFTVPYVGSTTYQSLLVNLPANSSSHLITGVSNWNLSNVTLTKLTSGSSGGSSTPSGPSTTFDDTAIINNSNENTQDIINNNNTNTQDIINNNNENTNTLNDSINDNCKNTTLTLTDDLSSSLNSYLDNNGDLHILSGASVSTYIKVRPNTTYTLKKITGGEVPTGFSYCLYNANKAYYRCGLMPINQDEEITINVDSYTTFIRFSMKSYLVYQVKGYICNDFVSDNINSVGSNVINGVNNATQNAINNANQNTQDIINNDNQNTEQIIDSNKVCKNIGSKYITIKTSYLDNNGNVVSNNYFQGITDYIKIDNTSTLTALSSSPLNGNYLCFYNNSKVKISCLNEYNFTNDMNITIPNNAFYFRSSIINDRPLIRVCYNGNQSLSDSIEDTNNYLKDDTDPNIDNNEITSLFSNVGYSDPLNYLLQLPTLLINKLVSLSDTCQSINLGTLLGSPIIFPCINLENIVGSSVWNTIDVICTVGLLVVIFKNLYQTFANLMTMGGEKEAREKFNMPTPMEFLSYILGGDR